MAKKSKKPDLPEWAVGLWNDLGSPSLNKLQGVHNGDLLERRNGLRRDDLIEVLIDARALLPDVNPWVRGRLISSGKTSLEILDEDGVQRFIARDTIVQIVLVAHTRPAYIDDKELLAFEREDMKRRSTLHEKVEKETTGNDDAHLWG
ncbi:MAG: hypothetical protein CMA49_08530 [Euryarchaeota archaeon]|jgi:hypothetical protein|nr:hypothetical protein [Euryarchaeota archaeon]DAC18800.1 MAG TPA: hypothetical protein D7H90_03440 [Candidatus Poseidoniales archaeon]HII32768.1 hypothetical protein [Candidatus Poseidoniaceae archaeon]MAR23798.1 hypothetical protein [Euryarchaeota archaeon]MBF55727.1 hypothetical protein [Euryarchaeota archaeon]|tara:strand:- start:151 stop:594 length:444 start_codon:yes stop_codon:yes gene_type:complete